MNAERLLAHFHHVADAPDAIARLRHFILDLAVRGKLVPQDRNDEPAPELLKRIARERTRLLKAAEVRSPKPRSAHSEPPFSIPASWAWSEIAEIGILNPRNEALDSKKTSFVPMPLISAEYGVANKHEIRLWGAIKKGYTHFAEGDVGLAKITPCFENGKSTVFRNLTGGIGSGTTELHIVRPLFVNQDYILLFLKSPHFIETGIPKMTGTAGQKRVPTEYFAHSPFPLPPLAEQQRIVAKVDELMVLCDRLETARTEKEAVRNRLAAASFARLNAPDPEAFQADVRFAIDVLPALTTRPNQIKQLRQTILGLAVRGKLVVQDQNDESAFELLKRIAMEKARLVSEKKLKRQKEISPTGTENAPFNVPMGWVWAKADHVFLNITDGFHNTPSPVMNGRPYISAKNIRPSKIDFNDCLYVDEQNHRELFAKTRVKRGDILIVNIGAGCGTPAMVDVDFEFSFKNVAIVNMPSDMNGNFILLFLLYYRDLVFEDLIKGGAQPFLGLGMLREMLIPIPPLAEQHRIVAIADALMACCDRLEANLNAAAAIRRQLLDALLSEALVPTGAREMEAAE
jgi:type I restriction enzyme S subunit